MTRQQSDPGDAPAPPGEAVDWAALRAAYEAGEETIAALCKRFAVTPTELAARRRAEGWPPRPCDLDRLAGLRRAQLRQRLLEKLAVLDAGRPPIDVEEVRVLYEESDVPNAEIRRRFSMSEHEFRNLRVDEGWTPRPQIADPGKARPKRKPPTVKLAVRLMRSLRRQITMLEDRVMSEDYEQSDADVRLMNGLARGLERIGKLAPDGGPGNAPDKGTDKAMEAEAADAEWMRDQLRQRLARLANRQGQGSLSSDDDS